jgi:hypothetical protein
MKDDEKSDGLFFPTEMKPLLLLDNRQRAKIWKTQFDADEKTYNINCDFDILVNDSDVIVSDFDEFVFVNEAKKCFGDFPMKIKAVVLTEIPQT